MLMAIRRASSAGGGTKIPLSPAVALPSGAGGAATGERGGDLIDERGFSAKAWRVRCQKGKCSFDRPEKEGPNPRFGLKG
jgi:hypothetical protein